MDDKGGNSAFSCTSDEVGSSILSGDDANGVTVQMKLVDRAATVAILEQSLQQLHTLMCMTTEIEAADMRDDNENLLEERFTDAKKMKTDLDFLTSLWEITVTEIEAEGLCHTFTRMLEFELQEEHEKQQLKTMKSAYEEQMRSLKDCLAVEKREYTTALENFKENVMCINLEYENVLGYVKNELSYLDQWERARIDQNNLKIKHGTDVYLILIKKTEVKIEREDRIHADIDNYLEEDKRDLGEDITYWLRRYEADSEKYDSKTFRKKEQLEQLVEDHERLKETYSYRQKAIDDWLAYKIEKARKEAELKLHTYCALKIQAWWRGTIIRKKLKLRRAKKGSRKKNRKKDRKNK